MSADHEFQPTNCNMCARKQREDEAAQGLRCANCLESFVQKYPFRSEDDESLCKSCFRLLNAPKSSRAAGFGSRGNAGGDR